MLRSYSDARSTNYEEVKEVSRAKKGDLALTDFGMWSKPRCEHAETRNKRKIRCFAPHADPMFDGAVGGEMRQPVWYCKKHMLVHRMERTNAWGRSVADG